MTEVINKLREQLGDPKGDFLNILDLDDPKGPSKKYYIEFSYRKKNTEGKFESKESLIPVAISFCPFTGKKLKND